MTMLSGNAGLAAFAEDGGRVAPATDGKPTALAGNSKPNPKEEIVYARLDAGGAVGGVYVVNSFEGGDVTDYGNYTSVKILNTNDSISLDDGLVHFSSSADKVYYEGYLEDAEMPWDFSIQFFLDGKKYTADEIAGKSGALTIKISVKRNNKCKGDFFDSYALQMTAALNTEICQNIKADEATVINAGKDKQLSYIVLPGSEKEFVITADVKNFEMDSINIGGVRLNLGITFNDSELLGKVREIQGAAAKLDDGAGGIDKGAATLKEGTATFSGATQSFESGATKLDKGAEELQKGILQMQEGVDTLNSRSASLTDGSAQIKAALGQINTKDLVYLASQNAQAAAGVQVLLDSIDLLASFAKATEDSTAEAALTVLRQQVAQFYELLHSDSEALSKIGAFTDTLSAEYSAFDKGISEYTEGVSAIANGYPAIVSGVSSLTEGSKGLADGALEIHHASSNIADGAAALLDGTKELHKGTSEFHSKTNGMDTEITGEIDSVIAAISGGKGNTVSFVSERNKNVSSVQFMMKTGAIKIPDSNNDKPAAKKEPTTLWEKFLHLFDKS
jgi:putative membrane protein